MQLQSDFFEHIEPPKRKSRWQRRPKQPILQAPKVIVLSREHAVLMVCAVILAICVAYSLGVEHGQGKENHTPETIDMAVPVPERTVPEPDTVTALPVVSLTDKTISMPEEVVTQTPVGIWYTIQAVTYRTTTRAEREITLLEKQGYNPFIIPSGEYSQVCIGKYPTRAEADATLKRVRTVYNDAFIRKRK